MKRILLSLFALGFCMTMYAQNLSDAQKAIEAEKLEDARQILENLVKSNPNNGENYFYLGNLYLSLQEDALARAAFEQGVAIEKTGKLNNIGLGQMALDAGKTAEAEAYFQKATEKLKKKDIKEYIYIAQAYMKAHTPNYEKAAEYARKAVAINYSNAQANLTLGEAEYNLGNNSEAYKAYRNAYVSDNNLLRGQLQIAVITKKSLALPEAVELIDEILEANPNYGPAYRELAEIYYLWSIYDEEGNSKEYLSKALDYYNQYMDKTDYSLNSRMRRADFLILVKDYEALEKEAKDMQKLDQVNPRIYRYLGYSAYENGNYEEAVNAINNFISKVEPIRVLGLDYAYLAKAEAKLAIAEDNTVADEAHFANMLDAISKAIGNDAELGGEFTEIGTKLFRAKDYDHASQLFGTLISAPKGGLMDKLYYSNAIFYNAANMSEEEQANYQAPIMKADSVYAVIIEATPTTQDIYFNRARLNRYVVSATKEEVVKTLFEDYLRVIGEKDEEEQGKLSNMIKMSEAYTEFGMYYSDKDKAKSIEYFEKAIALDPENQHAIMSLDFLKNNK